jgi:hypothetical protein
MLHYSIKDWAPIQQRLINAGYNNVPNGRIADSFKSGDGLHFIIEFDSEEDQLMFQLKWA